MRMKLGCDPEMFLADVTGQLKASCGLIGGTKEHPQPLEELGEGFAVQEDNVAIEFNIPPAESRREFVDSIARAVKYLNDGVNSMLNFHLVMDTSAASFPSTELTSPAAKEFGCDPDYNAWTGQVNPKPKAEDPNLRSCGGHVHIGYDITKYSPTKIIRLCDFYMGVPSVLMDEGQLRRQLYGLRGAYREKPYGVEYRTMSNFWIKDPKLTGWVWDSVEKVLKAADEQFPVEEFDAAILEAINKNNKDAAIALVRKHNLEVVHV